MAQRRMFSMKIIDSARFMKMPISSQLLYFHLGLRADDDGIVEAFNVIKLMGSGEDDLRVLVSKGFVKVLNEDLVTFICDWREHNKIRSDRKIDSIYKDLLLQIVPDIPLLESTERIDNQLRSKMYKESELPDKFNGIIRQYFKGETCPICGVTMLEGNTKPSVQHNLPISKGGVHSIDNISIICLSCNMALKNKSTLELNNSQVKKVWNKHLSEDSLRTDKGPHRIGKVRLGKVRLVKDIKSKMIEKDTNISSSDEDSVNSNELTSIITSWNALGLQNLTSIKGKRATMLKGRLQECGKESIYKCIGQIRESTFLKGQNNRSWVVTFDWLIKPNNYVKVLEGNYKDTVAKKADNHYRTKFHFENDRSSQYSEDELEKQILESQKKKFEKGE